MSYKVNIEEIKFLRQITFVETGVYLIKLESSNKEILETTVRIREIDVCEGRPISTVVFDSDEFEKQMMRGFVGDTRPICAAIKAFHECALSEQE